MLLVRDIRCFARGTATAATHGNTWAGVPAPDGRDAFWTLRAAVSGPVNAQTGYLCDIKAVDQLLREVALPELRRSFEATGDPQSGGVRPSETLLTTLHEVFPRVAARCPVPATLATLELAVSPYLRFTISRENPAMVRLTQSFEFAAAHRLYAAHLSDAENLRMFGKCSNPNGHGHNYVLEVTVTGPPDAATGLVAQLPEFNRIVRARVIDALDHRNLNVECPEFATLNPTVENIARVIWDRLGGAIPFAKLHSVRLWETPRTYAEYDGTER